MNKKISKVFLVAGIFLFIGAIIITNDKIDKYINSSFILPCIVVVMLLISVFLVLSKKK